MSDYGETAEAGWAWTLDSVRREPDRLEGAGIHSGWGGIGLALCGVRRVRGWTDAEAALADRVLAEVTADVETTTDCSWFDGLPGHVEVLVRWGGDGVDRAVARMLDLATPSGWATSVLDDRYLPGARINDATLGTAGVLRAAVAAGSVELADVAAAVLLTEVEVDEHGPTWPFVPRRFRAGAAEMPNWSHGAAGVATALAEAGAAFGRPGWVDLARRAAERLVAIGDQGSGLRVPHVLPAPPEGPTYAYGWCHGSSGTAQVFAALAAADVREVAGESPEHWRARCWDAVRSSGLPARLEPGFWDNDGLCCGTAGVGMLALDADDLAFARVLGDALVARAVPDRTGVCWRFVEHTAEDPLLAAAPGWMQGAAGISAYLFRLAAAAGEDLG